MKKIGFLLSLLLVTSGTHAQNNNEKSMDNKNRSLWGVQTAFYLNKIYNKDINLNQCINKPDYYCNGLMVSAFEGKADPYWMHQGKNGKLSLTYFRKDIATFLYGTAGYILFPQNILDAAKLKGLTVNPFTPEFRCAFPANAWTNYRGDNGCGEFTTSSLPQSAKCQSLGINNSADWIKKYIDSSGHIDQYYCGFYLDGQSDKLKMDLFQANIEVQQKLISSHLMSDTPYNEIILKAWEADEPKRIPVMALFYIAEGSFNTLVSKGGKDAVLLTEVESLILAQTQQVNYYNEAGIFIPVVKISGGLDSIEFTYTDSEQNSNIPEKVRVYPE